jgi:hypothetical protein
MTEPTIAQPTLPAGKPDPEPLLTVWSKAVDLQMHFNEMCMNLRRTAIGTLGALLAAGAIAFRFGGLVHVYDRNVSVALVFVLVAFVVWMAFYVMDRFWYHELLRASVAYAEELANPANELSLGFPLDMSAKIRAANHSSLRMTGKAKINLFYLSVAASLLVACLALYTGLIQPRRRPNPSLSSNVRRPRARYRSRAAP